MPSNMNNNRAFTLLELLVAMAMMSIIAASLYTSLSIGFKARDSSENTLDAMRSSRIVLDLLKQEIISSLPPRGILAGKFEGTNGHDDFGNESDSLVFYSAAYNPADDEVAGDIIKVQISLDTSEESNVHTLVRGITKNLLSPKSMDPYEEVLCTDIRSLNLRYFDGYDWQDEWDSSSHDDNLPEAVEIKLVFEKRKDKKSDEEDVYSITCAFSLPCA